jgi:hypothetical protein
MAIKTYTSGDVLTASDMNTYSANSGYVALSKTTITATATAQFVNAFNSTYRNYRAILELTGSGVSALYVRLLVGTTVQTGNILSLSQTAQLSLATNVVGTRGDQYALSGAIFGTYSSFYQIDFNAPFATAYTNWTWNGVAGRSNTDSDQISGANRNIVTTSMNGFEITTAGAANVTGTMTLYGVRDV